MLIALSCAKGDNKQKQFSDNGYQAKGAFLVNLRSVSLTGSPRWQINL